MNYIQALKDIRPLIPGFLTLVTSLGTNSSMFTSCSVFCDVSHVRSSVLVQNVMFGSVRSLVRLLYDQTSLGTYSLMFTNCSVFCDVRHVQSSILGQNVMFGKFDVRTFNVRSVRSSVFWILVFVPTLVTTHILQNHYGIS